MNRIKYLIFLILTLLSYNLFAQASQGNENQSVLILFSGSHDFLVNRNIFMSFEKVLRPNNIKVEAEYIGDNNSVFNKDEETYIKFLKLKYGENNKFDLVISFNKKAMDLCIDYGEEIFPKTTILGLDIFGEIAYLPPFDTQLDIINNLHKDLEHLLIVSDASNRGQTLKQDIKAYIDSTGIFLDQVIYVDFTKLNYSDIKKFEYYSKKKSVILLLSAYHDASSKSKDFREQVMLLNKALDLPIYTLYEKDDTAEVVGGFYLDVDNMVKQLSIKIMLILNSMPVEQVDFSDLNFYRMFFNKALADSYKIDIQQYKKDAEIIVSEEMNASNKYMIDIVKKVLLFSIIVLFIVYIYTLYRNKKILKELKKQKDIFSNIFNKSQQFIFIVDTKTGKILDYNHKVAKSDFRDSVIKNHSKVTDFFPAKINDILGQKEYEYYTNIYEIDFNTDKITFPTYLVSLNYLNDDQEISYLQFMDSSINKQELRTMKKLKDEAENRVHEANNLIDNFVREIRDPLNVKKGFEQLLLDNQDLTLQQKEKFKKIIRLNSDKLLTQIEKILIYSDLNNNTRILNNQEFSLNKCIRKITNSMQVMIKERNQNIKLINYFSLSEGKDILFNDKDYFALVFQEILGNAIKFTQSGIIECGYTHPNDGKIIFYIKDTGVGMNQDEQREAFNKFNFGARSDKKSNNSGIGVGLAICRNLISKMGGNIWLTSTENEGTTVFFYLDYDMSVFNETQTMLHISDIDNIKQKHLLIIDEDLGSQKFIIQTLSKYNIDVKTMPNYQFYHKYNNPGKQYDFIFFDYNSGFEEFIQNHKKEIIEQKISLVIMTRTILDEDITNKIKGIKYTILYKPIKLQDLINALVNYSS